MIGHPARFPKESAVAEDELIKSEMLASMLMRLFEFAPVAMAISTSDARTSSYAKVNDAYLKLTGLRWEDIRGKQLTIKGSAIDNPARDRRHRMLRDNGSYLLEEVDIRHTDGTLIPTLISAQRTVVDGISFDVEIILDVSSRVRHQREIERALTESARTDFLTGLANRAGFEFELSERIASANDAHGVMLAYIDLNGFKAVNDELGHEAGDEVLKTIASRLRDSFTTSTLIARVGGDEFAIIFDVRHSRSSEVLIELKATAEQVFRPIPTEGRLADVGAAVGLAVLEPHDTVNALIKRADRFMYIAKSTGQRVAVVAFNHTDTEGNARLPASHPPRSKNGNSF